MAEPAHSWLGACGAALPLSVSFGRGVHAHAFARTYLVQLFPKPPCLDIMFYVMCVSCSTFICLLFSVKSGSCQSGRAHRLANIHESFRPIWHLPPT